MFEIIKNAPTPSVKNRPSGFKIYKFELMDVGDAFDAPRDMGRGKQDRRSASIHSAAIRWAKKHNPSAKFTVRLHDENTVRCWRIA